MKDKRQGNDLKVAWSIFMQDGEPFRLDGKDVSLYLKNMFGRKELNDFVTTGNIIQWTFYGKDQKNSGKYSLEMVINEGEKGMITTDKCDFVNLVSCSCKLQGGEDAPNVETESIELTSTLEYVAGGMSEEEVLNLLDGKVDKEEGKGLSTNDYTTAEKNKLASLENYDDSGIKGELAKKIESEVVIDTESTEDFEFGYDDTEIRQEIAELSAEVSKKQDTITDLATIRSGAEKGATAIQEVKTINGQSIVGSGNININIQGGGGGTPSGNDTELLRMLAGNSPHVIWEDIYGKIHLDVGELKVRRGQNDSTFRTTARKIIAASFDTTSTDWTFFFGIQTEIQDSTIEEIYPYAFNDKKVTGFSWSFSCMPNVKDWSFIKYIDTSQCTYLYGVFNRANADKIDISHWDTSNVTSMDCTNSNFFGWTKNVIGLENWDTSKVTSIKNMFAYTGMESISGVSQWDVRKCQNLFGAFGRSTSLKSIDLSKWEIPEGADMGNMFVVCSVLETIGLPNIPSSAKTSNMLNYCYALKNVYMREGALIYASLNLNESSSLSAASVKVILSHLAETPDDGATITFASSLYSRYTAEDKAEIDTLRESAKANGWTIVNMG